MNNIFVICELDEGKIADVSLELMTKARSLANQLNCKLEALVLGHKLTLLSVLLPYFWYLNLREESWAYR